MDNLPSSLIKEFRATVAAQNLLYYNANKLELMYHGYFSSLVGKKVVTKKNVLLAAVKRNLPELRNDFVSVSQYCESNDLMFRLTVGMPYGGDSEIILTTDIHSGWVNIDGTLAGVPKQPYTIRPTDVSAEENLTALAKIASMTHQIDKERLAVRISQPNMWINKIMLAINNNSDSVTN